MTDSLLSECSSGSLLGEGVRPHELGNTGINEGGVVLLDAGLEQERVESCDS
jgi:hypothetical protein